MKDLRSLESLDLPYTKVTDAGLVHLCEMAGLKEVNLTETKITPEAYTKLQEFLRDKAKR